MRGLMLAVFLLAVGLLESGHGHHHAAAMAFLLSAGVGVLNALWHLDRWAGQ